MIIAMSRRQWKRSMILTALLSVAALSLCLADEEPSRPVCRLFKKNSLAFCSMVDYYAVVDEKDRDGALFDDTAKFYYDNVNVVLQRFGCSVKYGLYNCDDCREAYKYWICSIKFQKCGGSSTAKTSNYAHALCSLTDSSTSSSVVSGSSTAAGNSDVACQEGSTGRYRTCLSLCEDVVRKCPYVLNFQCPTSETTYFSTDISTCNKLDREANPDRPGPWPGTFADL